MQADDILDAPVTPEQQPLIYSTFWQRVGAATIDGIALGGFNTLITIYLGDKYNQGAAIAILGFEVFFQIFLLKIYGATPGKLALNLRVVGTDGTDISWGQAILRDIVWFLISLATSALPFIMESFPAFVSTLEQSLNIVMFAWTLLTAAVMGSNPRLRAPHDFIAGTVVVRNHEVQRSFL